MFACPVKSIKIIKIFLDASVDKESQRGKYRPSIIVHEAEFAEDADAERDSFSGMSYSQLFHSLSTARK